MLYSMAPHDSRRPSVSSTNGDERLVVFNCHEAWVHQLDGLPYDLDVVVGLKGRYAERWDRSMRPLPARAREVRIEDVRRDGVACVVAHNITDLLDVKGFDAPKILVIHSTLDGRLETEHSATEPARAREVMQVYADRAGVHVVAVSRLKGGSWGFTDDIVELSADPDAYPAATCELAAGLRVSNFVQRRREILCMDLHDAAFDGLPVRIVGHNPELAGVRAAESWDELKSILRVHRFFVHTADPRLEDGYNMATLEAMAAGLPVLGNQNPTSPIEHEKSGFLSDDPRALREHATRLLEDRELALRMGREARRTVEERFHVRRFRDKFARSIATARAKWSSRRR